VLLSYQVALLIMSMGQHFGPNKGKDGDCTQALQNFKWEIQKKKKTSKGSPRIEVLRVSG
jgi:hypothetical protein